MYTVLTTMMRVAISHGESSACFGRIARNSAAAAVMLTFIIFRPATEAATRSFGVVTWPSWRGVLQAWLVGVSRRRVGTELRWRWLVVSSGRKNRSSTRPARCVRGPRVLGNELWLADRVGAMLSYRICCAGKSGLSL